MTESIALLPAVSLLAMFAAKEISPVEVTRAVLDRIERYNGRFNAFCLVDGERALAAAAESERRWMRGEPKGLLDGVPASIKDLVLTEGWPTGWGSKATLRIPPPDVDAPSVARLREHGAVLVGKTTSPEFGWKGVTDSPLTGITRNPWNRELTPGGSSGGAAVAAALGMGAVHVGSDGGGSIRIPAAFSGIFGLKPSFGRVPAFPASAYGTLSHTGPLTRCVADAALMLNVMAEPDPRDWFSLPFEATDYGQGLEDGIADLRIAYSPDLGYGGVEAMVASRIAEAVEAFRGLGARVETVDLDLTEARRIFRVHWYAGAAAVLRGLPADQHERIDPGLREVAAEGESYDLPTYLDAVKARALLGQKMKEFHCRYDLLLTPSLPITAFAAGAEVADPASQERWPDWTPFSYPFNLTQQPAASMPCGLSGDGLPVGVQVVGPMHGDGLVLRACRAYESRHPISLPTV